MDKIIKKAVNGGWDFKNDKSLHVESDHIENFLNPTEDGHWFAEIIVKANRDNIIFSHSFLRAFFGEGEIMVNDKMEESYNEDGAIEVISQFEPMWRLQAKQLVLSEDRIEYLRRFL